MGWDQEYMVWDGTKSIWYGMGPGVYSIWYMMDWDQEDMGRDQEYNIVWDRNRSVHMVWDRSRSMCTSYGSGVWVCDGNSNAW